MRARILLTALAVVLMAASAKAEVTFTLFFGTGNALWDLCRDPGEGETMCRGFVMGIADAMSLTQADNGNVARWETCPPPKVPSSQMQDIATRFLREHPEQRHHPAGVLVAHALADAFPCPAAQAH
jgi:hypothetical protein